MGFKMNRPVIKGTKSHKESVLKAKTKPVVEMTRTAADASLVTSGTALGESLVPKPIDYMVRYQPDLSGKKKKKKKEKETEEIVKDDIADDVTDNVIDDTTDEATDDASQTTKKKGRSLIKGINKVIKAPANGAVELVKGVWKHGKKILDDAGNVIKEIDRDLQQGIEKIEEDFKAAKGKSERIQNLRKTKLDPIIEKLDISTPDTDKPKKVDALKPYEPVMADQNKKYNLKKPKRNAEGLQILDFSPQEKGWNFTTKTVDGATTEQWKYNGHNIIESEVPNDVYLQVMKGSGQIYDDKPPKTVIKETKGTNNEVTRGNIEEKEIDRSLTKSPKPKPWQYKSVQSYNNARKAWFAANPTGEE